MLGLDNDVALACSCLDAGCTQGLDKRGLITTRYHSVNLNVRNTNGLWKPLVEISSGRTFQLRACVTGEACGNGGPIELRLCGAFLGIAGCTSLGRVIAGQEIDSTTNGLSAKEIGLRIAIAFINTTEASMCVLWTTNPWGELEVHCISNAIVMEDFLQCWGKAPACWSF